MRASRFFRTPKGLVIVVLVVLATIATAHSGIALVMPGLAAAVLTAGAIDAIILRRKKKRWMFPDGAVLTGLFVAMILSPHNPWYVAAVTAAIGVVSKYALHERSENFFNPAAFGLVATFYVFHTGQSWWGALPELPMVAVLVLIATGVFIAAQVNKLPIVITFLAVYYALFTAAAFSGDPARVADLYRAPDLHAALFYAFFMVTDPPTSPPRDRDQLKYGAIAALGSFAAFEVIGAAYFLLAGLLVANLWEALRRQRARAARV